MKKILLLFSLFFFFARPMTQPNIFYDRFDLEERRFVSKPLNNDIFNRIAQEYHNVLEMIRLLQQIAMEKNDSMKRAFYACLAQPQYEDILISLSQTGNVRALFLLTVLYARSNYVDEQNKAADCLLILEDKLCRDSNNFKTYLQLFDITGAYWMLEYVALSNEKVEYALNRMIFLFDQYRGECECTEEDQKKSISNDHKTNKNFQPQLPNKQKRLNVELQNEFNVGMDYYTDSDGQPKSYCSVLDCLRKIADSNGVYLAGYASQKVARLFSVNCNLSYWRGEKMQANPALVKYYYKRARELGYNQAGYNLGDFYYKHGRFDKAYQAFSQLLFCEDDTIKNQQVAAYIRLSVMLFGNKGVTVAEQNKIDAFSLLERLAHITDGSYEFTPILSQLSRNDLKALKDEMKQICALSDFYPAQLDSCYIVGRLCCEGMGNNEKGITYLRWAAEKNHCLSQNYLGSSIQLRDITLRQRMDVKNKGAALEIDDFKKG